MRYQQENDGRKKQSWIVGYEREEGIMLRKSENRSKKKRQHKSYRSERFFHSIAHKITVILKINIQ